MFDIWY